MIRDVRGSLRVQGGKPRASGDDPVALMEECGFNS